MNAHCAHSKIDKIILENDAIKNPSIEIWIQMLCWTTMSFFFGYFWIKFIAFNTFRCWNFYVV